MSASLCSAHTAAAAEALAQHLAVPQPLPAELRSRAQSLAKGAAGIALLHIERAHTGTGSWETAHSWLKAATCDEISAADTAGLYFGVGAISFVLHAADADGIERYGAVLARIDAHVSTLAHRRIDLAQQRIDRAPPTAYRTRPRRRARPRRPGWIATSLPGLGPVGATRLLAATGRPGRFRNAAAFKSFTGLEPKAASA